MRPHCLRSNHLVTDSKLAELAPKLAAMISDVKTHLSEQGRVVMIGYPQPFPDSPPGWCQTGLARVISPSQMKYVNDVVARVNRVIEQAAADGQISYVNVSRLYFEQRADGSTVRHDFCIDGGDRWVNRIIPSDKNRSVHPKAPAHAAEAVLVRRCLDDQASCVPRIG